MEQQILATAALVLATAALELSSFAMLAVNEAQAAQSHHQAATQFTHLLLQGHIQDESLCKSL
jgi:hypothetical protein